jgi:predicted transcriptional regulator
MILALSKRHGLTLQKDDIDGGIKACLEFSGSKMWSGSGINEDSAKLTLLVDILRKSKTGELTYSECLRKLFGSVSTQDLARLAETMIHTGIIESGKINNELSYKITELGREFLQGIGKKE